MTKKYSSPLVLVETFHLTYGQIIRMVENLNVPEKDLRKALIQEEVEELEEAFLEKDFIEVVDALADILYVTYGAALTHGINVDARMGIEDHTSPVYVLPYSNFSTTPKFNDETLPKTIEVLKTELVRYSQAEATNNLDEFVNVLINIIKICYKASAENGVDIDLILAEVQRSNMSKLDENGNPIRREDGKILKGKNFFSPDINRELKNQGW